MGMPSFTKLFHTPDTTAASANCAFVNPQEWYIAYVTPMAMAAPPGSVLATAVDAWLETAACE